MTEVRVKIEVRALRVRRAPALLPALRVRQPRPA
jgi:hypothetical protein